MKQEELREYIGARYDFKIDPVPHDLTYIVPADRLIAFCEFLLADPSLRFDNLMCLTAVDEMERIDVIYLLSSYSGRHRLEIKVPLPNESLTVPSITPLWPGANWHEREVYDLYGVRFSGHPDPRRIMLPDDWEGHPMRKNYKHWNLVPLPDDVTEVTKDYPDLPAPVR